MQDSGKGRAPGETIVGTPESAALDKTLVRGLFWTGGFKWASQVVAWVTTIKVASLLTLEDYGVVAMANTFIGLLYMLSEFGIGVAVVSLRDMSDKTLAHLNAFSVLFGLACFAIACVAGMPLGAFYEAQELHLVVACMGTGFIVAGFRNVPAALLQRDLRFKRIAFIEAVQLTVGALGTLAMGFLGWGYWALILGNLLSQAVGTSMVLSARRHGFALPRAQALLSVLRFSSQILVSRFCWYVQTTADSLVAGKLLGKDALGAYSMALTLAMLPVEKLTAIVAQVTASIFAAVQKDPSAVKRYLLKLTEGFTLLTMPCALGIALVARPFVLLALGGQWEKAIVPMQILACHAAYRAVQSLPFQALVSMGGAGTAMRTSILGTIVLPIAFLALCWQWGTAGLALGWLIVFPAAAYPNSVRVFRWVGISFKEYFAAFAPALTCSALMALGVLAIAEFGVRAWPLAVAHWLGLRWPYALELGVEAAAGGLIYVAAALVLYRQRVTSFLTLVRRGI